MPQQLPIDIMKKAVKGIGYIAHPLRLRILEFIDVNGSSSVSAITKGVREEQVLVSQSLRKLRDADLVKTEAAACLFTIIFTKNIRPAFLPVSANCSAT